jgi:hypothetical protein
LLFPLLAAEIVIARAFWRLFAPLKIQLITRLLHGSARKMVAHGNHAIWRFETQSGSLDP